MCFERRSIERGRHKGGPVTLPGFSPYPELEGRGKDELKTEDLLITLPTSFCALLALFYSVHYFINLLGVKNTSVFAMFVNVWVLF